MGLKAAEQPHKIDRGLGLNLVIGIVAAMGKPELDKLISGIGNIRPDNCNH